MSESQPSSPYTANRPRMCRNCGAIVGASEAVCSACGATQSDTELQTSRARRPVYDIEAVRFARAILTRPATFSIIFLMANIFVAMLMWASSGFGWSAILSFPENVLIAYGAKVNFLINGTVNNQHQWWRFLTPIFIHIGFLHLLLNMYGLWQIGPLVERLYGSAKFVVFWVVTGICGVAASYFTVRPDLQVNSLGRFLFKANDPVSAGASGALFGLVGVLFVFGIKFRHELPENFKRAFGTGMLPVILINFFIGYVGRGLIDNAAHVGGLLAGATLAAVVDYRRPNERGRVAIFWRILQTAALALVAVSFVMVARNFKSTMGMTENARVPAAETSSRSRNAAIIAYGKAINAGQDALTKVMDNWDASEIESATEALTNAPHLDEHADKLRDDLKAILQRAGELASIPPEQRKQPRAKAQQRQLERDFQAWSDSFRQWIHTEGKNYGLSLEDEPEPQNNANQGNR